MDDRRISIAFTAWGAGRMVLLALAVLAVAACASRGPVPAVDLAVARTAIEQAQRDGAIEFAPDEFNEARAKLERAEQAVRDDDPRLAARLASQAELDARLAQTIAGAERAEEAVEAARRGLEQPTDPLRLNEPVGVTPYR